MPVITGKQVALAVQSKALTHVVTNYDAVVTGKLVSTCTTYLSRFLITLEKHIITSLRC